jgi:hypothetical protein
MRGEEKSNYLAVMDKQVMAALKAADWDQVGRHLSEMRQAILDSGPSKADSNWSAPSQPLPLSATLAEKRLGWAIAEGYGGEPWLADILTGAGLLGDKLGRSLDLLHLDGEGVTFFAFKVTMGGEDIFKGLRDFLVNSVLYRAFLQAPRHFGYNTERSPLRLDEPPIRWELVGPKDLINPRKSEMRWGERDTQGMQRLMKGLGVTSFAVGRLQAEAEALQANLSKDNFSAARARQWFENRVSVVLAQDLSR